MVPARGVDLSTRELVGDVAAEVVGEVAEPVRALRDRLGLVVDHLERHVATATGPSPYPWRSLQSLRQDLAAAYLEATTVARRIEELAQAVAPGAGAVAWFDAGAATELGLRLAGHHVATDVELVFDLGDAPPARGAAGVTALVVAQLVAVSARSARARQGSALSVRVGAGEPGWVTIAIADNGDGDPQAERAGEVARGIVLPWGATVVAASDPGRGCAFELHLVARP